MRSKATLLILGTACLLLSPTLLEAKKHADFDEYREWESFKEFQKWKAKMERRDEADSLEVQKIADDRRVGEAMSALNEPRKIKVQDRPNGDPPPIDDAALMGRYIVNQADWTSVATISSSKDIKSFPFVNIISFSDGPLGNGSGVPYMFLTPLDFTGKDLAEDRRVTLMMTLAQGQYCKKKDWDPMDPRCARIVLTGKARTVKNDSAEIETAKEAVFGRHPWLAHMPKDHHFFFATLKIYKIAVLDTFGGPKYVSVKDYFHPQIPDKTADYYQRFPIERREHENENLDNNLRPRVYFV
ncbi:protein CREG1 [Orussus abietinus]|uniref:protein CREG1 n=1 Tax=Orussus abietinus TaxID=222816 RepID=UPI000625DAF3|nr:protein CREG1 [Orussus abietinus]